jgi:hypothetical protein
MTLCLREEAIDRPLRADDRDTLLLDKCGVNGILLLSISSLHEALEVCFSVFASVPI